MDKETIKKAISQVEHDIVRKLSAVAGGQRFEARDLNELFELKDRLTYWLAELETPEEETD